uniref:Death domain-containing protein n=1 Tax=Amphimedon queenslandica TaxID=400682 RepID=A0A1X7SP34_AMPQE
MMILQEKEFPDYKWFDFGLKLDVCYNQLQVIKNDTRDSHPCLRECLAEWLKTDDKATYKKLIDAVKGIGECAVADTIEKHLSTK